MAARLQTELRYPEGGGFYEVATGCLVEDLDGADRNAAVARLQAALTPPTIEQAEGWLALLQAATAHRNESDASASVALTLYAGSLAQYPADVAKAACAQWAKTQKWFPTLSELMALCDRLAAPRRCMIEALRLPPPKPAPTPEERAEVATMARALDAEFAAKRTARPGHDFSKTQGRPDETGITPELRALRQAQGWAPPHTKQP